MHVLPVVPSYIELPLLLELMPLLLLVALPLLLLVVIPLLPPLVLVLPLVLPEPPLLEPVLLVLDPGPPLLPPLALPELPPELPLLPASGLFVVLLLHAAARTPKTRHVRPARTIRLRGMRLTPFKERAFPAPEATVAPKRFWRKSR
jgi:hypothetical protein